MLTVICPQCSHRATIPPEILGRKLRCKKCRAEFIAEADEGAGPPRRRIPPAVVRGVGLTALVAASFVAGWTVGHKQSLPGPVVAAAPPETVASVNAAKLWREFGDNAIAAELKYGGKYVELTGKVRTIEKGDDGRYRIGFQVVGPAGFTESQHVQLSERERRWYQEGFPPNLICVIAPDSVKDFAAVKENQTIHVSAKVAGSHKADVFLDYVVDLTDGHLLP